MLDQTKVVFELSAFFDMRDHHVPTHFKFTAQTRPGDVDQLVHLFPKNAGLKVESSRLGKALLFGDLRDPVKLAGVRKYHIFRRAAERMGFRIDYVRTASNSYKDEEAFELAVIGPRQLFRLRGSQIKQLDIVHMHSGVAWRVETVGDISRHRRKARVRYLKFDHSPDRIGKRRDWIFRTNLLYAVTRRQPNE